MNAFAVGVVLVLLEWGSDVNERLVLNARCVLDASLNEIGRQCTGHSLVSSACVPSHISHAYAVNHTLFMMQQQACSSKCAHVAKCRTASCSATSCSTRAQAACSCTTSIGIITLHVCMFCLRWSCSICQHHVQVVCTCCSACAAAHTCTCSSA